MAGAGGTGPQKPQQPDQLEQIREALVQAITQHLSGPEPTAPQYQPTPISPMQGYAIARNPQAAGLINQTIQAPGQARYMQQQAAFEAALSGRKEAMAAAVGLLGQQSRANSVRPGVSWQQRMVNGTPHTFQVITDPQTGMPTHMIDFGERFVPPAISPYIDPESGAANLGRVSRTTGAVSPVTSGGQQVGAVPPQGIITDVGKGQATLEGMDAVTKAYSDIRQYTQANQQSPWGQWVRERAVQKAPGPMSANFPEYATYVTTRQAALNAYIKSVTGAQFSVAELQRYEGQFPEPWDPPDVASNKIAQLKARAVTDMQGKLQLYPSLGGVQSGQQSGGVPSIVDEALRRADEIKKRRQP